MEKNKKHDTYYIMSKYEEMRKQNVPEKEIAEQLGLTTIELRKLRSAFYAGSRVVYQRWAKFLEKEGKTHNQIALILGKEVSSVKLLLDEIVMLKMENAEVEEA